MFTSKVLVRLGIILAIVNALPHKCYGGGDSESETPQLDGFQLEDLNKAKTLLISSLEKLTATGVPSYSVGNVQSASKQVIAGFRTDIEAELVELASGNKKNCHIIILQPASSSTEITLKCSDNSELVAILSD